MKDYSSRTSIYFFLTNLIGITIIFIFLYINKFGGLDVINPNYILLYILSFTNIFLLSFMIRGPRKIQTSYKNTFFKMLYIYIPFSAFVFALSFIFKSGAFSRKFVLLFLGFYLLFIVTEYFVFSLLTKTGLLKIYPSKVLIVGAGRVGERLFREIQREMSSVVSILGFLDDNKNNCVNLKDKILGTVSDLESVIKNIKVDEIYITIPLINENKIRKMIELAEYHGVKVRLIPNYFRLHDIVFSSYYLGNVPVINVGDFPLENGFNRFIKRIFDIFFSFIILTLISPLLLIISLLIKLDSRGPVFFNPVRIGLSRKEFKMYKFRSMFVSSQEVSSKLSTSENDSRITRFGKFIRKYNLDELPQFVNVLKGDMSIVGPRPHRVFLDNELIETVYNYRIRQCVKPGITGWAQINGFRGPTDTLERKNGRVNHDLYYIQNWSLWLDIKIIFLTIFGKQVRKNAF